MGAGVSVSLVGSGLSLPWVCVTVTSQPIAVGQEGNGS